MDYKDTQDGFGLDSQEKNQFSASAREGTGNSAPTENPLPTREQRKKSGAAPEDSPLITREERRNRKAHQATAAKTSAHSAPKHQPQHQASSNASDKTFSTSGDFDFNSTSPIDLGDKNPRQMTKILIAAVALVVVLAVVAVVLVLARNGNIGSNGLAARVNGEPITTKQLDAAVAKLRLQSPQVFSQNSGLAVDQIRKSLLDELVNQKLVMQSAKDKSVNVTSQQVNQQIDAIKKQYGTQAQFDATLKNQGYTLDSLKTQLTYQLAAQGIAKKLVPDTAISSKDMQAYYDAHKKDFTVQAGKQVAQIQFALSDETKANTVLQQAKGGADFAQLAQKNSTDSVSAAKGGDLGWTPMNPPLDAVLQDAVNQMKKGDVSTILKSSTGLHILKVTDVREASVQAFEAVQPNIKVTLLNTKRNQASQSLLTDLRKKAKITIYDKVVKDYESKTQDQKTKGSTTTNTGK